MFQMLNHQGSAPLPVVLVHRLPVDSPHKGPVMREGFPCHDAIMQHGVFTFWGLIPFHYTRFQDTCSARKLNFFDLIRLWVSVMPILTQIANLMGPTWSPPGSCRPPMGPMLAPWTLLSGYVFISVAVTNSKWVMLLPDNLGKNAFTRLCQDICQSGSGSMPNTLTISQVLMSYAGKMYELN